MANLTADVRFSGDNHVKSHILLDSINWHAYQGRGLSRGCEKKASEKLTKSGDCRNAGKAISQTSITYLRKCLPQHILAEPACDYGRVRKVLINYLEVLTISAGKMILSLTVQ